MTDYRDHPKSVTEVRGERSGDPSSWTPRDVLVNMLRKVDSGEMGTVTALVIVAAHSGDDGRFTSWSAASPDLLTTLGLLMRAATRVGS